MTVKFNFSRLAVEPEIQGGESEWAIAGVGPRTIFYFESDDPDADREAIEIIRDAATRLAVLSNRDGTL